MTRAEYKCDPCTLVDLYVRVHDFFRAFSLVSAAQHAEKALAVLLDARRPHSMDLQKRSATLGLLFRHLEQRPIVGHDVRWHPALLRDFRPARAQTFEEHLLLSVEHGRRSAFRPRSATG